jgi:hypothetical protein
MRVRLRARASAPRRLPPTSVATLAASASSTTRWRDILYALRTFRRAPLAALTIVGTVALGLGLITMAFTLYSTLFLRSDAVQNPAELVAVERPTRARARTRCRSRGLNTRRCVARPASSRMPLP